MTSLDTASRAFRSNVIAGLSSQLVSVILSAGIILVLPKLLGTVEFGYFQMFLLYAGLAGWAHLGANDGMQLRLGGMDEKRAQTSELGGEFWLLLLWQCLLAGALTGIVFSVLEGERAEVLLAALVYMPLVNSFLFLGYLYQALNRNRVYAVAVVLDRLVALLCVGIGLMLGVRGATGVILLYMVGVVCGLLYLAYRARSWIPISYKIIVHAMPLAKRDVQAGMMLLLANLAGVGIISVCQILVDVKLGVEQFGQLALGISLVRLLLLFFRNVGMVAFPFLRTVDEHTLRAFLINSRAVISAFGPLCYLAYFPISWTLSGWLNEYETAIRIFGALIGLCLFEIRYQLVHGTLAKVLSRPKLLLVSNSAGLILAFASSAFSLWVFESIGLVLVCMTCALGLRALLLDRAISRELGVSREAKLILEVIGALTIAPLMYWMWFGSATWIAMCSLAVGLSLCGWRGWKIIMGRFVTRTAVT